MEFNQVRYFLTLANTLNFTRAAESCNVTQPALTRAIQKLEDELGGLLFYRERSLTQLTELGHLMLPFLEQTSAAAQAAREQALAFKRRDSAPLRLGLDPSIATAVLTPVLGELAARIKGFTLSMREASSPAICTFLLDGTLDAGLVVAGEPVPERLNRWKLYDERLAVLCPPAHEFAGLDAVPVARLAQEQILRRDVPDCAIASAIESLAAGSGLQLQVQHSGSQEDHLHAMIKVGLGVALVGEFQTVPAGLVARPLAEPEASRAVTLVAAAGRQPGPAVAGFLKLMRARDWGESAGGTGGHGNDNPDRLAGRAASAPR